MKRTITSLFVSFLVLITVHTAFCRDNVPPSQNPPGNLHPQIVPQFVVLGFDDQMDKGAMEWVVDMFDGRTNPVGNGQSATFDGTPARAAFYTATVYLSGSEGLHKTAYQNGHEMGNHTHTHVTAFSTPEASWKSEMQQCSDYLAGAGISKSDIEGFRTPFLQYSNATFRAMVSMGFVYDCSVEEGFQFEQKGGDFFWPYTLDNGSPGNKLFAVDWQIPGHTLLESYPGFWEMPCYVIIIPPDEKCEEYGLQPGLRKRIGNKLDYFDTTDAKITGLDYNLLYEAGLDGEEMGSVMCYNLDLFYDGNRAPMNFGLHSNYYSESDRKSGLEKFVTYALSKPDVRIIPPIKVIEWIRNPVPLHPTGVTGTPLSFQSFQEPMVKGLYGNTLHVSIPVSGVYTITLYTMTGKEVMNVSRHFHVSNHAKVNLNAHNVLPTNMYIVRILGNGLSTQAKLVGALNR